MSQLNFLVDTSDPLELLNDEDWVEDGGMTIVDGNAVCNPAVEQGFITQDLDPEYQNANLPLYASINVISITQGYLQIGGQDGTITTPGVHTIYIAETTTYFSLGSFDFCDAEIDTISLQLLNDNQLGAEIITNGAFASAASWTSTPDGGSTTPWSIAAGVAHGTSIDEGGYLTNAGAAVAVGEMYKLSFTISNMTEGSLNTYVETAPGVFDEFDGGDYSSDGAQTVYVISPETGEFAFYDSYGVFDIDNISVRKYTV